MDRERICAELKRRCLPELSWEGSWEEKREQLKILFQREEFGFMPTVQTSVSAKVLREDPFAAAGQGIYRSVDLTMFWEGGSYTFPVHLLLPKEGAKACFLNIAFPPTNNPLNTAPAEEIVDRGFGIVWVDYSRITSDDNDFSNGLAGAWYQGRERGPEDPGKIMLWAWALTKVMDYLETEPLVDSSKVAVVGHSRLGKTALCTGMMEERLALSVSNDSGCAGAAVNKYKTGETVERICEVFPFWFDAHYQEYGGDLPDGDRKENHMPFDQHFLLASIAPRRVYVASAKEDDWADPLSEQVSGQAAREIFQRLGLSGDYVGSHVREGGHSLSRYDWLKYMEYMEKYIV